MGGGCDNVLNLNETSGYKLWIFDDPTGVNFTFFANVYGNLPPAVTSAIKAAKVTQTSQSGEVSQATEKGFAFYANTGSGGAGLAKSLNELETKLLPQEFSLFQNYPNPFNPTTFIHYNLPEASDVQLVVYDLLGNEVRHLWNATTPAGYHQVEWDGKSDSGQQVAAGLYFYVIEAGPYRAVRKMLYVR